MLILYILISVFIAWIWVDYYRLIDIYESESLKYFILTFILGAASVFIVFGIDKFLLSHIHFNLNGELLNDFLYSVFRIGLVEEIAKAIPFLAIYFLFRKQINEPIDYLAFICVSALGFSAAENVLYFQEHGPHIISGRAILSTVGHMFHSSLIAYGIIRYKYYSNNQGVLGIVLFFFLAALSHGFYNFWLLYDDIQPIGGLITILYFLITISLFARILNNALNHSTYFTYKKVVNPNKVASRLLFYYGIVFLVQFILLLLFENFIEAVRLSTALIIITGFIIVVTCVRMSRFKLVRGRWENLKIELPFSISQGDSFGIRSTYFKIRMKGESFNEANISVFYEEYFSLKPLSKRKSFLGNTRLTYIEEKLFLKNDESYFLAKVFYNGESGQYEKMLLKPKTNGTTLVNEKYPIVGVFELFNLADNIDTKPTNKNYKFKEWAYIVP